MDWLWHLRQRNVSINSTVTSSGLHSTVTSASAWWNTALSPSLSAALQGALDNSPALHRAAAEVDAARAELRQAEAALGPNLSADADVGVRKVSSESRSSSRTLGLDDVRRHHAAMIAPTRAHTGASRRTRS